MLPVSLPSLLVQDYPGHARIILVDDCSSDGTGPLARDLAARYGGLPLTVVTPGEPERGLDGQAVGPAARDRGGPAGQAGLPAADRRGHRTRAGQPARSGGSGRSRRPGRLRPGVADGAAAGGERLGAPGGARVRLFLRAALPVPPGQQRPVADGRGGGRLCPAAYGGRRAGADPRVDPAGGDRRRVAGTGGAAQRRPDLAGAGGAGGQCAAVSTAGGPVADGRAQRVRPVAAQSAAAGGDGPGAAARLCGAARDAGGGCVDG
ncbi:hypothetical protein SBADM41S_06094 [Streptomyces badius]